MRITNRQAAEAQFALATLLTMELPMKASLEVALLANQMQTQVDAYARVRDALVKKYQIKVKAAEKEGEVTFTSGSGNGAVAEFTEKMAVLVDARTGHIKGKIRLPNEMKLRPEVLKPLAPFIAR